MPACSSDNVSISFANRSAFTKRGRFASKTLRRRSKSSQDFMRAVTSTAPDKSELGNRTALPVHPRSESGTQRFH